MTDLDTRLRSLGTTPIPDGPLAGDIRTRANRRRARRRVVLTAVPVLLVLVVGVTILTSQDDSQSVVTGTQFPSTTVGADTTSTTTTDAATTTTRPGVSVGNVEGLTIQVTPTMDLEDGQLVTVEVEGLDQLTTPVVILCAGDVQASTAARDCDLTPLEPGGISEGEDRTTASQQVAVRRVIRLPRMASAEDDQGGDYDCATEPAGCAIVVGNNTLPASGVGVAITFADDDPITASAAASPAIGLQDQEEVRIDATGLRPNSTYAITQCSRGDDPVCDEMTWPEAKTDGDGTLRTTYRATAAIYGWKGRADCTAEPCVISLRADTSGEPVTASIAFASDVAAPVPRLEITPAGPYEDQQVVTVTGTGFPPGHEVAWELGLCPNDKDTAVEERCGYDAIGPDVAVDADGRFTDQLRLHRSGACSQPAGCHLGWVINHGPTLAKVPLTFR